MQGNGKEKRILLSKKFTGSCLQDEKVDFLHLRQNNEG